MIGVGIGVELGRGVAVGKGAGVALGRGVAVGEGVGVAGGEGVGLGVGAGVGSVCEINTTLLAIGLPKPVTKSYPVTAG